MKIKNKNRYAWRIFRLNGHFFEIFLLQIIIQEKKNTKKRTDHYDKKREKKRGLELVRVDINPNLKTLFPGHF